MALTAEQLDELLSGYIDGELSATELKAVQHALATQSEANVRLDELQTAQGQLRSHFSLARSNVGSNPSASNPGASNSGALNPGAGSVDLASTIIAAARKEAVRSGLPASHFVLREQAAVKLTRTGGQSASWRQLAAVAATLAAAITLAVYLPPLLSPRSSPNGSSPLQQLALAPSEIAASEMDLPGSGVESSSVEPSSGGPELGGPDSDIETQYVSQLNFANQMVLVVDVELSDAAAQQDALGAILRKHGVVGEEPIVADGEVSKAIEQTRVNVRAAEDASDAMIYMLRADFRVLGAALDDIYFNEGDFPRVAFDLAIDNPAAKLMENIAKATGTRFAVNSTFSAPVVVPAATPGESLVPSPFADIKMPERFVSSSARKSGFSSSGGAMLPGSGNNVSTILLLVREP